MTLLMIDQYETNVFLLTDTLATEADWRTPASFEQKVMAWPRYNMVTAITGTVEIGAEWYRILNQVEGDYDVDELNTIAPEGLRTIFHTMSPPDDLGHTTLYHFGYPTGSEQLVRYTYSSRTNFEPERFHGNRFSVKPAPQGFDLTYPETVEERLALVYRIRDEQNQFLADGKPGVRIDGELILTTVASSNVQHRVWHQFPNYAELAQQIQQG